MSIVLGIDPGTSTGYAILRCDGSEVELVDCGEIPIVLPGDAGRLECVWKWLNNPREGIDHVVFEEFVKSHYAPSNKEAHEIRGLIRLWCSHYYGGAKWAAMTPTTISSQLGVGREKGQAKRRREFVHLALKMTLQGRDHIGDAAAVAMAYALQQGLWSPVLDLRSEKTAVNKTAKPRSSTRNITDGMTDEQVRDGIRRGTIPVRRGK